MPTHNIGACACCGAPTPVCDPVSYRFLSLTIEINGTWTNLPGRYVYQNGKYVYLPAGKQYNYNVTSIDYVLEITHSDNNVETITAQDVLDRTDCNSMWTTFGYNTQDGTTPSADFCIKICNNKYMTFKIHLPLAPSDAPNPFTLSATLENTTVEYGVPVICTI